WEPYASERERNTTPCPRFIVVQQAQQVRRRRRRNNGRPSLRRGNESHLRRRIRIANEPLIFETQDPSKLFFPRDGRRFDRRGGRSGRSAGARAREQQKAQSDKPEAQAIPCIRLQPEAFSLTHAPMIASQAHPGGTSLHVFSVH